MKQFNTIRALLLLALVAILAVTGCDRESTAPSSDIAPAVRIEATGAGSGIQVDSTDAVVRIVVTGDQFGRLDSTYQLYAGRYFEAALDLPVGVPLTVTLTVEEIVNINVTAFPPDTTFKVLYSGSSNTVVRPGDDFSIVVPLEPVVPMVRLAPRFTEIPSGETFQLALEVRNLPGLILLDVVIDFGYGTESEFLPLEGSKGSSLGSSVEFSAGLVNDDTEYEVFAADTTATGAQSMTDQNGNATIALIEFDSKQVAEKAAAAISSITLRVGSAIDVDGPINVQTLVTDQADISLLPAADTVVTFPDPYLRDAVLRSANLNPPLTLSDVLAMTIVESLSDAAQIDDLTGIDVMQNLEIVNFFYGTFTDISLLANIQSLEAVTLSAGDLVNIAPLANLPRLQYLDLSYNSITSIAPLVQNQGLGAGDTIDLTGNPLDSNAVNTDIPALEERGVTVIVGTK